MMPSNPLAAKFTSWSDDEDGAEDAFSSLVSPFPSSLDSAVRTPSELDFRASGLVSSPSAGGSSSKKKPKKTGKKKGGSRKQDSPSSEGSPLSPLQESPGSSMLPAALFVKDMTPARSKPVVEEPHVVFPPLPDPIAPPFLYVESPDETPWRAASSESNPKPATGGLVLGGGRRAPRSRATSVETHASEGVAVAAPEATSKVESESSERTSGVSTPFKAKAELYGLVVPDRPQTPLPPPPQAEHDNDDDDDDDDDIDNGQQVVNVKSAQGGDAPSKEELMALQIAKDAIMSPKPPVEAVESPSEKKERRSTWRKSLGPDKGLNKKRESKRSDSIKKE